MTIRTIAALFIGLLSAGMARPVDACVASNKSVEIASFNVKWIGYFEAERDNEGLANLVKGCDIVVIQELVAPPDVAKSGKPVNWPDERGASYPNGKPLKVDDGATNFFLAMADAGFNKHVLSEEDTGPRDKQHNNSAVTEWFVAFYKSDRVCSAWDEGCDKLSKGGFIARDLTANADYDRVPFAFPFRALRGSSGAKTDFVLISVHLRPDDGNADKRRRQHELKSIAAWIDWQIDHRADPPERDFIILGDMNIQDCEELEEITPAGLLSLNDECRDTVPSKGSKPYDHVMFAPERTTEIDRTYDLHVIDLVKEMRPRWSVVGNGVYPGSPYKSRIFPKYFSDHHPVHFRISIKTDDDVG